MTFRLHWLRCYVAFVDFVVRVACMAWQAWQTTGQETEKRGCRVLQGLICPGVDPCWFSRGYATLGDVNVVVLLRCRVHVLVPQCESYV